MSRESRLRDLADKKEKLELEREILASNLEKLDYKIIQTQAEYGALCNETAPILNLPIEILCRVFEAAHNASFAEEIPHNPLIEVTISHTCRGWRSIALSFPILWSTFRHDASELSERIPVDRLGAYLERSGSRLLDLHFAFAKSVLGHGSLALLNFMLESTTPHVARWRRFSLFSDGDVPILAFCNRLERLEAPNLEYFTMCPGNTETIVFDGLFPSVFLGGAPKLFYLRLDPTCPSKYLPPFSNVTVLRLEDDSLDLNVWDFGSYSTFLEILALPSLTSLSIVGRQFSVPDSPHSSKITMNNLKHLRYGADDYLIRHFLPFLFAPLLETLILGNTGLPLPPSPFPKFMRPFSKLHSLELINCIDIDMDFLSSFAPLTPHITNLTIVDSSSSDSIFQYMVEPLNAMGITLWPNVKILTGILFHEDSLNHYISFAKMLKNPELIICTGASFANDWRSMEPASYELLQSICVLEQMPAGKRLVSWPPGVDVPAEDGFFTIEF